MVKLIVIGLWVCAVTLGAAYAAVMYQADSTAASKSEEFFGGLDYVKTEPMSVPMVTGGEIKGYVIAQFVFTVDGDILRKMSVPPTVFLVDEAYRTIYAGEHQFDFKKVDKRKLDELTKEIASKVNARFKIDLVKDVLLERFDYVAKGEVRAAPLSSPKKTHADAKEKPASSEH